LGFNQRIYSKLSFAVAGGGIIAPTHIKESDRAVLREYARLLLELRSYHYAIFEHLGSNNEEQQWANYRIN
jgi:hypothetical protein